MGRSLMWFCPKCETWVGSKLDECLEGHSRPWRPVLNTEPKPAWEVTFWDRVRAKISPEKERKDDGRSDT